MGKTDLVRGKAYATGSLEHIAEGEGTSLAEAFLGVKAVVVVDVSGSMAMPGSGGNTRYELARDSLAKLQGEKAGAVAIVAFSTEPAFCPGGVIPEPGGGTDMLKALRFCKVADVPGVRFVLISDGEPTCSKTETMKVARTFGQHIDTIFVGAEGGDGREFLRALSAATGGSHVDDFAVSNLLTVTRHLLEVGE